MKTNSSDYRIVLSDGSKVIVPARSAGEAIEEARWLYRDRIVTKCYLGMTEQDFLQARAVDNTISRAYSLGTTDFEIPVHTSIPQGVTRPKATRVRRDETAAMFDDAKIVAESALAKEAFAR